MKGRFNGWTEAAVNKLILRTEERSLSIKVVSREFSLNGELKKKKANKNYIPPIVNALQVVGLKPKTEYKFVHDRRFKFDLAFPEYKIAIEFEGGIFEGKCNKCDGKGCKACKYTGQSRGRHTRGNGYSNDCKKYNLAVMHGWKLLRYTPDRTRKINWEFEIAAEVRELINSIKNIKQE